MDGSPGDALSAPNPLQPFPMQIPRQLSQLILQGQLHQLGSGAERCGPGLPPRAPPHTAGFVLHGGFRKARSRLQRSFKQGLVGLTAESLPSPPGTVPEAAGGAGRPCGVFLALVLRCALGSGCPGMNPGFIIS